MFNNVESIKQQTLTLCYIMYICVCVCVTAAGQTTAGQAAASVTQGTHQNDTTTAHKTDVNSTQQLLAATWLNLLMFAISFSSIQFRS